MADSEGVDVKKCTKCGETKPLDAFGKNSRMKNGLFNQCKPCVNANNVARWNAKQAVKKEAALASIANGSKTCTQCGERKPLDSFHVQGLSMDGYQNKCIACFHGGLKSAELLVEGKKRCALCHEVKPLEGFYLHKASPDGRGSYCRPCSRAKSQSYRDADPETSKRNREKYLANRDGILARMRERYRDDPEASIFKSRQRDSRKKLVNLGDVHYKWVMSSCTDCYLCGKPLDGELQMDHVIPLSRGGAHARENLRPTHAECNLRKHNSFLSELTWYHGPVLIGLAARELTA